MNEKPPFKKITQVALVVKDCQATAKHYWDDFGIGPWKFYTLTPDNTPEMTLRGAPVSHAFRAALAKIGDMELELIEPLDGISLYAEHLAAHGEGLHHVGFEVDDFDRAKDRLKEKGYEQIQGGRPFDVTSYAYFDTNKTLACLSELGSAIEEGKTLPEPDFTYP